MSNRSKRLFIDMDVAIENRAKELMNEVISKHMLAADKELRERFDKLSDHLVKEVSESAKAEFSKHFKVITPRSSK